MRPRGLLAAKGTDAVLTGLAQGVTLAHQHDGLGLLPQREHELVAAGRALALAVTAFAVLAGLA